MSDYFLHHECTYTFDKHGIVSNVTPAEERRLWKGKELWHEHIETSDDGQAKPGRTATPGDRREFQEFAKDVNSGPTASA